MNAFKNVMINNYKNMELNEYLRSELKDTGYGGVEVQKTPIGTRITLYATRPGLVIGRKGAGIKELTTILEEKFGLSNPQISVIEVEIPELNPNIMATRIAQLVERGTAFRRAALWTLNTVMGAGAMGVEITVAGKLRSERAHFEKHSTGIVPKSGNAAEKIVKVGITDVVTKMGLMGIQVRIALKNEIPGEFELLPDNVSELNKEEPIKAEELPGEKISETTISEHSTDSLEQKPIENKDIAKNIPENIVPDTIEQKEKEVMEK